MGLLIQWRSGELTVVGSLYSVSTVTVGWVAHSFYSVVFAALFTALIVWGESEVQPLWPRRVVWLSVAFSLLLWLVPVGVWLIVLGIPSPVANLGLPGLLGHLVWV